MYSAIAVRQSSRPVQQPESRRRPYSGARRDSAEDEASRKLSQGDTAKARSPQSNGFIGRKRSPQPGDGGLLKKSLEGGGKRRARLPQRVVALTQLVVRSQTRQESASTAFVELVVDQRDKFGVIVGHEMVAQALLF